MRALFRAPLALTAVVLAALVSGCAQPRPPAPPPPPPPVSLSPQLIEQASAYRFYMTRTSAISPAFADGAAVAGAIQIGAAYEPRQLLKGAIAYAAVVALQDPAFVVGARIFAVDPGQRRQVADQLVANPAYALGLSGSASAAGLVITALGADGTRLYDAGKAVKQAAYDLQHQPWSTDEVQNRDIRLLQAKTLSTQTVVGDVAESTRLQQAATGAVPLRLAAAAPAAQPYSQVVVRGLALAALGAMGEADETRMAALAGSMDDRNMGSCMSMAKLNLYQCLAVSRPHYEDVFCLGQHVMMDTGRCVIKASGLPEPFEPRFIPTVKTAAAAQSAKPAGKPARKKR